ncbi:MAG: glycosyltransferase [Caulobacteraceae bacterium]|nr:glycosyltransferase [Caulobacteraceae bacterium]
MPALVDVIIPVYNGEKYLVDAVRSIQEQTVRDIRVIVVDDGSTDATPQILEGLARSDARISILTKPNSGIVDALNLALSDCSADFIARHDADDLAYPDRFETQLDYLNRRPDCVALSGVVRHIDARGEAIGSFGRLPPPEWADASFVPSIEPYLIHPFLMMRRSAAVAAGGYRHVLHSEDTDLYWRLRERGKLHNLEQVLGDYRLHDESISGGSLKNGRVMAISSQLSAISARRRAAGAPDLKFDRRQNQDLKDRSDSLEKLYDYAQADLDLEEKAHLRAALSAKMLELAGYRPYEVALSDCSFMRSAAVEKLGALSAKNRAFLVRRYSGTVARLAYKGRWSEARALLWPEILPATLYRLAMRIIFPPSLRASVKKAGGQRLDRLKNQVKSLVRQSA